MGVEWRDGFLADLEDFEDFNGVTATGGVERAGRGDEEEATEEKEDDERLAKSGNEEEEGGGLEEEREDDMMRNK
jgi:hypothetical protein